MTSGDRSERLGARFVRVWTASTVSNLGDGVFVVALPLLAASLTRDAFSVSLVVMAGQLPWLVFSFVSGALVDRWDRRTVMWTADLYRMAIVGVLAVCVVVGWASVPLLAAAALLLSVGEILFDTAAQSILPSIVAPRQLERANSRLMSAQEMTNSFLGAPVGGALFSVARSVPFFFDAVALGFSALLVRTLPGNYKPEHGDGDAASLWEEIKEGFAWLWRHRLLRTLSLESGFLNFWHLAYAAVIVLHAQDNLGVSDFGFGVLVATSGIGAIVGAAFATRLSRSVPNGVLMFLVVAIMGVAMAVIGATSSAIVAGMAIGTIGSTLMVRNVVVVSLRQTATPDALLGRVTSAYRIAARGGLALGAIAGGLLATWFGLRAPMIIGGIASVIAALAVAPVVTTRAFESAREAARR